MRRPLLALLSVIAAAAAAAPAGATVVLREDGLGPLTLGMSRAEGVATGWLSDRTAGCELERPRPVVYSLRGPKAPAGLRGSASFSGGKLAGVSVTRGARTALGIRPNVNTAAGMARVYRRAGYRATAVFEPVFQATFVTVSRGGEQRFSAIQTGRRIDVLAVPFAPVCE